MSPQLGSIFGSVPVVINSYSSPVGSSTGMYAVLSIPVYVMSHAGGVRPCQMCVELPGAVEEDEAEAIRSPSVDKPLSVDSEGGLGKY